MIILTSLWWQQMSSFEKIHWIIAVPFSAIFIILVIMSIFVGDSDHMSADGHADVSVDHDMGIEFQFITLKNLVAFFTIFSWTGIVCIHGGLGNGLSVLISLAAGLLMMVIMATIVYLMGKLVESGTLNLAHAVGKTASVYLTIPAKGNGMGKVQIQFQGLQTLDAVTNNDTEIKTGSIVTVKSIVNQEILLVEPNLN